MIAVLNRWNIQDLNIVTDSLYVAGVVQRIERALLGHVNNPTLFQAFVDLRNTVNHRTHRVFIMHIKSHTRLPGGLVEGNARADQLVAALADMDNIVQEAYKSHAFFHQSATALRKQFNIPKTQARAIVAACPDCATLTPLQDGGANPRGLQPRGVWQTDITVFPPFGRLRYLHVSVDTCSSFIWASAHASASAAAARQHWTQAIAVMGCPKKIKTDNGPAYRAASTTAFLQHWGIQLLHGVPHNSTGQAIVERAHRILKHHLVILKKQGEAGGSPHEILAKTLFVLNWLNIRGGQDEPPA